MEPALIEIEGAREHNLKNISVGIPRNALVVFTGVSGSGKSSLAFDTIYAEGQRRYIETFSAYARQFLGALERPDVDKINGLSPVIAIEQKTTNKNPRSTVGTVTEVYDFLRLLFARVGEAYSPATGEKMVRFSLEEIQHIILENYQNRKIILLAPLVRARKGNYKELFETYNRRGFEQFRIDGELQTVQKGLSLDRFKTHDIELVVDKLIPNEESKERCKESTELTMKIGGGLMMLLDVETNEIRYFSQNLMCPSTGISLPEPEPNTFSFNSPKGYCPECKGLGTLQKVTLERLFPDEKHTLSHLLNDIDYEPLVENFHKNFKSILEIHEQKPSTPFKELPDEVKQKLLYGMKLVEEKHLEHARLKVPLVINFDGIIPALEKILHNEHHPFHSSVLKHFSEEIVCEHCQGSRLHPDSLHFKIGEKNIFELSSLQLNELYSFLLEYRQNLSGKLQLIGDEILKEILKRLEFLLQVGLDYLTLHRPTKTLSGGESQRIRLATQIGSQLVNVLYILDEPSIGLHPRDNEKLIQSLKSLRDLGNSVIVVEHDKEMMLNADYIYDIGPGAGKHGGEVVWCGTPDELMEANTTTADFLVGRKRIVPNLHPREGNERYLELIGCSGNNLKDVHLRLPLGKLIVITGVSGSGKSSLINHTLVPAVSSRFYRSEKKPLPFKTIKGLEHIDKIISVDQSPIGRTPRSNPATYTGVFTDIRNLFAQLPEAKIRGYKSGRFSFNVKGGRCETCQGSGMRVIEMNFLPDVMVHCETCNGKRFNRETLQVRYRGKSISDVLNMTVEEAMHFFSSIPKIHQKLQALHEVGLDYITLGQPSTTLSGGEAQRVKLATELSKKQTGKTLYVLDEPTTGLHFQDVEILLNVLNRLVDLGNTVVVIEHNMDVIKSADYIIDIGPEGGDKGGTIVAQGTVLELAKASVGYTSAFLQKELQAEAHVTL